MNKKQTTHLDVFLFCWYLFISLILISNWEAQKPYGLSPFHIGLTYIATGTSSLIGSVLGGWISDWSAKRFSQTVEGRLILSVVGSLLCPLGLLLCGWFFNFGIHWAVPLIGSALFCFGEAFMYNCKTKNDNINDIIQS
jgi:MFS family permease